MNTNHAAFLRSLVEAAIDGRPLPVPPEEARRPVELCTAIYTSAISGEAVSLPLSPDSPFYRGVSAPDYRTAMEQRRVRVSTERSLQ